VFYKFNEGYNEICGDKIKIYIIKISLYSQIQIYFSGEGCSISIAYTSIIIQFLNKFPSAQISKKIVFIRDLLKGNLYTNNTVYLYGEILNEVLSLVKINKFPDRVKCASLGLCTLQELFKK
jgi:NifU-like protein involved in Fe-S cluster formation